MIFNAGGGSCGPLGYAAIGAVFSPNTDCTCSNGTLTYTANNSDGYIVFGIPSNGTWTVTCGSISKTVAITHKGQCEIANVKRLYLFGDDREYTKSGDLTVGSNNAFTYTSIAGDYGERADGNGYLLYHMDVTNYSTMTIVTNSYNGGAGGGIGFYIGETVPPFHGVNKITQSWTGSGEARNTNTMDISSYTGNYYIGIDAWGNGSLWVSRMNVNAESFYLE